MKLLKYVIMAWTLLFAVSSPSFAQTVADTSANGINGALVPCVSRQGTSTKCTVMGVVAIDPTTGNPSAIGTSGASYRLATSATIASGGCTTPVVGINGGTYIVDLTATAFNSSTITLQRLGPDNATYITTTASWTANGSFGVAIGANATVKLCATGGSPTGVNSTAS